LSTAYLYLSKEKEKYIHYAWPKTNASTKAKETYKRIEIEVGSLLRQ